MGRSSRPTLRQLRRMFLLVGECCELGADPIAWRRHMTEGLLKLLGASVAVYNEAEQVAPYGEQGWLTARMLIDAGWPCQSDREAFLDFSRVGDPTMDGSWMTEEFVHSPATVTVTDRQRLLDDRTWYRGRMFNDFVGRGHLDAGLAFQHRIGSQFSQLAIFHGLREPDFDGRQLCLLRLFGREYRAMYGTRWARAGGPSVSDLPPRVRQVLVCLMEGDSEKQVALRLGISPHTVHDYVKQLHHRFEVSSRGELLARCRKFWRVLEAEGDESSPNALT